MTTDADLTPTEQLGFLAWERLLVLADAYHELARWAEGAEQLIRDGLSDREIPAIGLPEVARLRDHYDYILDLTREATRRQRLYSRALANAEPKIAGKG